MNFSGKDLLIVIYFLESVYDAVTMAYSGSNNICGSFGKIANRLSCSCNHGEFGFPYSINFNKGISCGIFILQMTQMVYIFAFVGFS